MDYRVFNEKGEWIYQDNNEAVAKSFFDKRHKDGFDGWIEDENGNVIAGRKPITIDMTPTWTGMLSMLLALYEDGKPEARAVALEELQRMAKIADSVNKYTTATTS